MSESGANSHLATWNYWKKEMNTTSLTECNSSQIHKEAILLFDALNDVL